MMLHVPLILEKGLRGVASNCRMISIVAVQDSAKDGPRSTEDTMRELHDKTQSDTKHRWNAVGCLVRQISHGLYEYDVSTTVIPMLIRRFYTC